MGRNREGAKNFADYDKVSTFKAVTDGPTDGPTDRRSDRPTDGVSEWQTSCAKTRFVTGKIKSWAVLNLELLGKKTNYQRDQTTAEFREVEIPTETDIV